jgi:hypothetical protein
MAVVQKNKACEDYSNEYLLLTDTKKNTFARLCNKLLNDNFIYASRQDDYNDYYSVLGMRNLIENFFSMIDYDLVHIDTYKIFYIQTNADRNRLKLKKLETVIVLVLRLLYHKGSLDVNSSSDISTTLGKMITEINQTSIFKNQVTKTEYKNALTLLRRYKLIDFSFTDFEKEDSVIVIYPTILYVAKIDNIDMLNQKIKTYIATKESDTDEVDED